MTVVMTLKGGLEPVLLEDDFSEAANSLNMAGMKGMSFIVTRTDTGENIAIAMDQILTVMEVDS